MLLYANNLSNRLLYIVKTILGEIEVTSSVEVAKNHNGLVINYSENALFKNEVHIQPVGLLFETQITTQNIDCFKWHNEVAFFKTQSGIGFDILAASFYLLSRYEEYIVKNVDEHFSFSYKDSLAYKEHFLHLPLINIWWQKLQQQFVDLQLPKTKFKFISSFDIDIAYKYKHHSILKNSLGLIKSIVKLNLQSVVEQCKYAFKRESKDPYDIFDWLEELHQTNQIEAIYFYLTQTKRSKYDVNISSISDGLQQLLINLSKKNTLGIHPSYLAGVEQLKGKSDLFEQEINQLSQILKTSINVSRQHYLVMQLPKTYEVLIKNKITNDYTMGYNYINGFRASYCKPFYWFNLQTNTVTNLLIHPFCAMDSNYLFNSNYNQASALAELQSFYDSIKKYDGVCITIFHNHFVAQNNSQFSWQKLYKDLIQYATSNKK